MAKKKTKKQIEKYEHSKDERANIPHIGLVTPASYSTQLNEFLAQAKTDNLKTKHFSKKFSGTTVKVSFGQGGVAKVPWISFLIEPNTTSKGIYPVYLFYKNLGFLILAYGISETNSPNNNWNLSKEQTIEEYFEENNFGKPFRYGESYVYRTYEVDNLPSNTVLDNDLNNIISEYKNLTNSLNNEVKLDGVSLMSFELSSFRNHCKDSGLIYSDQLITRFVASLLTKPFVILTGLSGSGKTKLAQAFVQWICESKEQYCIVPVGADWTNREPLLGYTNALDTNNYVLPENGALELIIKANEDESKPYFLILDEMNLSHVERYFADFLSVMESDEQFKLHSSDTPLDGGSIEVAKEYSWPKNLFVIGTVNIDETTYMFSPKVLDRANTIEFRVNAHEMNSFLDSSTVLNMQALSAKGAGMAEDFVKISMNKATSDTQELKTTLESFFVELQKVGAEFGYRTATEIQTLLGQIEVIDSKRTESDKIDIAIMQKLLPKLHGSRRKLCPILETLAALCIISGDAKKDYLDNKDDLVFHRNTDVKYPLSLEKITRMYKGAIDNGFSSYAEA